MEDRGREELELIVTPPKRVVSVKLDVDLIEYIDSILPRYGYSNRSEFIREAIMFYLAYLELRERSKRASVGNGDRDSIRRLDELEKELESVFSSEA